MRDMDNKTDLTSLPPFERAKAVIEAYSSVGERPDADTVALEAMVSMSVAKRALKASIRVR